MQYFNPNPAGKAVGDCVIRAIAKATGESWGKVYMDLAATGHELSDMPSANAVVAPKLHTESLPQRHGRHNTDT